MKKAVKPAIRREGGRLRKDRVSDSSSTSLSCCCLFCGRRFRTLNVIDDFSREVLAIAIDVGLSAERVTRVLDRVVAWRGYPSKLRMDNGPEFISSSLADWAEEHAIGLEFIQPGKPT